MALHLSSSQQRHDRTTGFHRISVGQSMCSPPALNNSQCAEKGLITVGYSCWQQLAPHWTAGCSCCSDLLCCKDAQGNMLLSVLGACLVHQDFAPCPYRSAHGAGQIHLQGQAAPFLSKAALNTSLYFNRSLWFYKHEILECSCRRLYWTLVRTNKTQSQWLLSCSHPASALLLWGSDLSPRLTFSFELSDPVSSGLLKIILAEVTQSQQERARTSALKPWGGITSGAKLAAILGTHISFTQMHEMLLVREWTSPALLARSVFKDRREIKRQQPPPLHSYTLQRQLPSPLKPSRAVTQLNTCLYT